MKQKNFSGICKKAIWSLSCCILLAFLLLRADTFSAATRTVPVPPPRPYEATARRATGTAADVIRLAKSQRYYAAIVKGRKKYSWFGSCWGAYKENMLRDRGEWCSDFASWCLVMAGVPGASAQYDLKPFREAYKDSMYKFIPSLKLRKKIVKKWFKHYKAAGKLGIKDLRQGDILQICDRGKKKPHHTVILDYVRYNKLYVVEGNKPANGHKSGVRIDHVYYPDEVIAVLRPDYRQP